MPPRSRSSLLDDPTLTPNGNGTLDAEPEALTPSGGRGFKQKSRRGIPIRLPGSGEVAVLKRPTLMGMSLKGGHVPNPLSAAVLKWIALNDDVLAKPTEEQQIANYQENAAVFVEIASLCFVHPRLILDRLVDDDNDDEIGPGDLADRDYTFIVFRFVEGEAAELAPFLVAPRARGGPPAR